MSDANLGSIGIQIHGMIENIPTTISGNVLLNMIDNQRRYIEIYAGQTLGSTAIPDRYHYALINLTCAELLHTLSVQGVDAASVSLGDFSISKGQGSNLSSAAEMFRERGIEQLKNLGWRSDYYQAL